jgi:hypothetical protein
MSAARSSARGRKGAEPPEKVTSKMQSRETPSPPPATTASTPSTRSMTLAKKPGESKTLPSIIENTPTPELSPSNSRVSSPTPTATHSTLPSSANQPPPDFKYTVRDIPVNLATQKAFYNLLVVTLGLKSIQLRVNYNKTALVITKAPLAPNFVKTLQVAANSPTITIAPINRKTPGPASAPKKPTFSVVVRDVPQDISAEEIAALCPPLSIVKAWRIVSRKSNRPTSFIRVLSTDKVTVDYMLINGIVLYGRTFECETSHPPTPTPLQCPRCFQFGHGQAECTNKAICPKCPESHPPNRCPAKEPSCSSCNGPHPAWSRACPSFKQILVTDETPVLPVKIIDPPTAIAEPTDSDSDLENDTTITIIKSLITFMTKTLFDLFPMQRSKIQTILENTSKSVFNVVTKVSHSGHKIHLTFDQ